MKTGFIVGLVLAVIIAVVAACRVYQPEQSESAARSKNSGVVGQGNQAGLIRVIHDETVGHKEDPTFRTKDCDYIFDMRDHGWMTIEVETESVAELREALAARADRIMLDNRSEQGRVHETGVLRIVLKMSQSDRDRLRDEQPPISRRC